MPRSTTAGWLLALAALLAGGGPARASTYVELAPPVMVDKADLIFVGTVATVTVEVRDGRPWTDVVFRVDTAVEGVPGVADAGGGAPGGTAAGSGAAAGGAPGGSEPGTVTLSFLGGDPAGADALTVSGMPTFATGDRLVILAYDQPYASPVVGFRQGVWRVRQGGLVDLDDAAIGVDGDGALVRGADAAPLDRVLEAIRARLGTPAGAP